MHCMFGDPCWAPPHAHSVGAQIHLDEEEVCWWPGAVPASISLGKMSSDLRDVSGLEPWPYL